MDSVVSKIEKFEFSENQKYLWDLGNQNCFYHQFILELKKDYSSQEIKKAVETVLCKHDVLSFKIIKDKKFNYPFQYKHNEVLEYHQGNAEKATYRTKVDELFSYDYNPENNQPIRFCELKIDSNIKYLAIRIYSLWSDNYAGVLLCKELEKELNNANSEIVKEDEKIEYVDYCAWQKELIQDPEQEALHFWDAYNYNTEQHILFNSRSKTGSFQPKKHRLLEVSEEYSNFKNNCRKLDINAENNIVLHYFNFLNQFSKEEITIGYSPFNRNYTELDHTLGYVNKILPLVYKVDKKLLPEQLSVLKEKISKLQDFSDYLSFNKENETVNPGYKYSFEYVDAVKLYADNELFKLVDNFHIQDEFEIKLICTDTGSSLIFDLYFDENKFESDEIELIKEQLKRSLSNISHEALKQPKISDFENEIITRSNSTSVDLENNSVLDLFNAQVIKNPQQTAIQFKGNQITYQELDLMSNSLANTLIDEYNVKQGEGVTILLENSEILIISILAVLKSGGYYIPLDIKHPEERIGFILKDTNSKVLLTAKEIIFSDTIQQFNPEDTKWSNNKSEIKTALKGEDIAYCIYTSGSSGVPKGCLISHKNLMNYVVWANGYYFDNLDIGNWGMLTSISFDLTVTSVYTSITRGKTLWIGNNDDDILSLLNECFSQPGIDTIKLTPTHITLLKDLELSDTNIKTIICGGEQLTNEHLEIIKKINSEIVLYNEYGPTETTVGCIAGVVEHGKKITVGIPINNTKVYILDERGEVCPIGVSGEIIIAGEGVSKAYLNRPELTKEKFIFQNDQDKYSYKTGDVGKWLPEGEIEYLGRNDDQIKIRGFRVEPEEIQKVIQTVSEIDTVFVLPIEVNLEKELVAFYKTVGDVSINELKNNLEKLLPDYMVPNFFQKIEEIPLTVNGKLNKIKLLEYYKKNNKSFEDYIAPRTETESSLVSIWETILNHEKIGVKDDFFNLGGQSLKATRLLNEYRKAFEIKLTLKELFESTTLESHAQLIEDSLTESFQQIEPIQQEEGYRISDGQKRLWVISQFEEASTAYNVPYYTELAIEDIESFKKAIYAVVERHEILRTVFRRGDNNELKQWVLTSDEIGFAVHYKDYSALDSPKETAESYINEDRYEAFDLYEGPLLRTSILKIAKDQYILYLNTHHIISDGWSMQILERDVFDLYNSYKNKTESKLPDLKIQYKDYTAWCLDRQSKGGLSKSSSYWLNKLSGELSIVDLPTQKIRPKLKTYNGNSLSMYLPEDTCDRLKVFVNDNGGSLFMSLMAAFKVLLYRYTHQEDIIVGTVIDGRDHADLKDQIGYYINSLALRSKMNDEEDFVEFYNRLKTDTIDAYDCKDYPFNKLVEELSVKRDTSRNAIFDITLVLQNMIEDKVEDWIVKDDTIIDEGAYPVKYDLSLTFQEFGGQICFNTLYNTDVYDQEMIKGLMSHFKLLLSQLLNQAGSPYSKISFLQTEEKKQLLEDFNHNDVWQKNDVENCTVLDLFHDQVAKTPDDIALMSGAKSMTFKELDILSNQLARCLLEEYAVEPGSFVGILLDRGEKYVVSILGILKAGAAYVPIDPNYPDNRKEFILNDTAARLLISDTTYMFDIGFYEGDLLAIDVEFDAEKYSSTTLDRISPETNTYVIYTSGSTGNPKGVLISHDNLYSSIIARNEYYEYVSSFLLVPSFSFDSSIAVLWESLTRGSTLHLVSDKELKDPDVIASLISDQQIAGILCVPSYYNFLLEHLKSKEVYFDRTIVAGEALDIELVKKHYEISSGSLYNEYGPTENTVWATATRIQKDIDKVTIGTPIANTKVYILDEHNNLVPKGIIGEICLSGKGIAKEYINQEKLTNEKFVADPFEPEKKMYKTGDYAKWLPDGNIEFIGRKDDQVKIRGYRIETGEIENILKQKESIESVIVIAKELEQKNKELVAYVVANENENTSDLRAFLSNKLPDYMVPSHYVQLDKIPLTANGKIDKKGLPDPQGIQMSSAAKYVAPENEIEQKIIEIIALHLGKDNTKIGTEDNFFDLGADSLKIVNILSDINKNLNIELKVLSLFENPNVKELVKSFNSKNDVEEDENLEQFDDILDLM